MKEDGLYRGILMSNTIIVKIESGIVSEVYASAPIEVIVVDHDVIEGAETLEQRVRKSVSTMYPDGNIKPEDIQALVTSLVLQCIRPADRKLSVPNMDAACAA